MSRLQKIIKFNLGYFLSIIDLLRCNSNLPRGRTKNLQESTLSTLKERMEKNDRKGFWSGLHLKILMNI